MKEILARNNGDEISQKSFLKQVIENQPPVMYWWFGFSSISFCSVYIILLTKF